MRLGQEMLEPSVLLLEFFQTLGLIDLQPTLLTTPTVVGLVCDLDPLAGRRHGQALPEQHIRLAEFAHDLFCGESLPSHRLPDFPRSRCTRARYCQLDQFKGGIYERAVVKFIIEQAGYSKHLSGVSEIRRAMK